MQNARLVILKTLFLLLTIGILILSFYTMEHNEQYADSQKGLLDLTGYDLKEQGMLTLDGEWQFFLNRFIEPVDYSGLIASGIADTYISPPKLWNYYDVGGMPIPGFGYGTYRLYVSGVDPNEPLALKILPESTAYDLYIDRVQMAGNGVVGKDAGHSSPGYRPKTIVFTPHTGQFVITIHISNFTYARGGMWDAPTLGAQGQIEKLDRYLLYRDLFFEGCYFICFLMFLVIYIHRPANRAWLYFGLLCMVTAARIMIYGAHLINGLTNNYRIINFVEYSTRMWFPILMLLLLNAAFSGNIPKKFTNALIWAAAVLTAAVAFLPIRIYTAYARPLMLFDFVLGMAMLVLILWPGGRFFPRKENMGFLVYGMLSVIICGVYDLLLATTSYFEMTPIGFFIALLSVAFILAITYTDALSNSEKALRELELQSERRLQTELRLLQSQIKPHFLYNALSAIANICVKDGKQAEQLVLDLAGYMQTSFDFSSNEKLTTLESEMDYIRKYVKIEKARFGDRIQYSERIGVSLDTQLPRLIIEPLVENAIRHGISKKKGGGEVILNIDSLPDGISVVVFDNGVGMNTENLSAVFRGESRSIGLKNIQGRLTRQGDEGLKIETVPGEYTKVSFILRSVNG
jgi:signal transduction histidine kinase